MEDHQLDLVIGQGPAARTVKLDLPHFTLVGATTRAGALTSPLRDRFGLVHRLEFYSPAELQTIVTRSAGVLGIPIDSEGASEIAGRVEEPLASSIGLSNGCATMPRSRQRDELPKL